MNVIWHPRESILQRLTQLANSRGQSTEEIISEAVTLFLDTQTERQTEVTSDALIGLFSGWPSLATQSEQVLREDIAEQSGWTWKDE